MKPRAVLAALLAAALTACGGGGDWDEPAACPTVTERPAPGQAAADVGVCALEG